MVAATASAVVVAAGVVPLGSLPAPGRDIPAGVSPPLAHGRNDVHGWLWLPIDNGANVSTGLGASAAEAGNVSELQGWFYHHTPEFWWYSCHNFEIMIAATLRLDHSVGGLPLPPLAEAMNTEYVFTPPAFSLDELINGEATQFYGHFTNGSFDTPQYYILSNGTLTVDSLPTVHYLWDDNVTTVPAMKQQAYLSYPRAARIPAAITPASNAGGGHGDDGGGGQHHRAVVALKEEATGQAAHLYWLHVLRSAPDYDQIVHVTVDPATCDFRHGDSFADVVAVGATFGTDLQNDVLHRLHSGEHQVTLFTNASRDADDKTTCNATVLREVHCVVMPDSFATCPPL